MHTRCPCAAWADAAERNKARESELTAARNRFRDNLGLSFERIKKNCQHLHECVPSPATLPPYPLHPILVFPLFTWQTLAEGTGLTPASTSAALPALPCLRLIYTLIDPRKPDRPFYLTLQVAENNKQYDSLWAHAFCFRHSRLRVFIASPRVPAPCAWSQRLPSGLKFHRPARLLCCACSPAVCPTRARRDNNQIMTTTRRLLCKHRSILKFGLPVCVSRSFAARNVKQSVRSKSIEKHPGCSAETCEVKMPAQLEVCPRGVGCCDEHRGVDASACSNGSGAIKMWVELLLLLLLRNLWGHKL